MEGTLQLAPSGKSVPAGVRMLPAGTVLRNLNGTTTTLAVDTWVFIPHVSLADSESGVAASIDAFTRELSVADVSLMSLMSQLATEIASLRLGMISAGTCNEVQPGDVESLLN